MTFCRSALQLIPVTQLLYLNTIYGVDKTPVIMYQEQQIAGRLIKIKTSTPGFLRLVLMNNFQD